MVKGTTLGVLPGAGRLYFRFGVAIPTTGWAGRAGDVEALAACRDLVKNEVEAGIAALCARCDGDPRRALLPRVGDAVRLVLSSLKIRPPASLSQEGALT